MHHSAEINDIGLSPSFSCYSDGSLTSTAAAKVSREYLEFSDIEEDEFEFSLEFAGEKFSAKELALDGRILLPIFNTDLVTKDEVDHHNIVVKEVDDHDHDESSLILPLEKLLVEYTDESQSSSSSSELVDMQELENTSSGTFCVSWRKKADRELKSPHIKKSRSTGSEESGSRRWKIKDIFRRSNSVGKETLFFVCPKRVEASFKKGLVKSGEAPKVAGKPKMTSSPSIHELFYVNKRAEQKEGKMKSYLPYRKDILGFKVHVNGSANKKLPF